MIVHAIVVKAATTVKPQVTDFRRIDDPPGG